MVVAHTWQILEEEQDPLPVGLEKMHILWLLILMKEYPVIQSLSSTIDGHDEKTTSKLVYYCLEEVNFLAAHVVSQTAVFHRLYTVLFLIIISISVGCSRRFCGTIEIEVSIITRDKLRLTECIATSNNRKFGTIFRI